MKKQSKIEQPTSQKSLTRALTALFIFLFICLVIYIIDNEGFYLWAKAIHIIAVISWMAGMLYMPRLFVYHTSSEPGTEMSENFKVMEYRLMKIIMTPAMIITWIFGLYLAWAGFEFSGIWLYGKLLAVLFMSGVHGYFSRSMKDFNADLRNKTAKHWRIMNEVPTILMIFAVIMVVVKPF